VNTCRSCQSATEQVLDLGGHYLPDFIDPGEPRGDRWPLTLVICTGCGLLQLEVTTPRHLLYHDRYGFKSGVNEAIRADLADVARHALTARPDPATWLDIACNDGTLLSNVPDEVFRCGIDPLGQFRDEALTHADAVIPDFFRPEYCPEPFDVITSVSMFYDLDDPGEFVEGVASVLAPDGVWLIQQNYAAAMLGSNAVDNICHEHCTYFSVGSLQPLLARYGLEINGVGYSEVNGGCFRVLVSHQGVRPVRPSVEAALGAERVQRLGQPATWLAWGEQVAAELDRTRQFLQDAQTDGRRVLVYGASTRGGTILQMIGAGPELLPAAVERNPAKVGKIMAATGIPIISEEEMRADPPDALLVSPWFFRPVFLDRERDYLNTGGRMVFPLPHFEVADAGTVQ
jgi:SAM-dependent methyltransferase